MRTGNNDIHKEALQVRSPRNEKYTVRETSMNERNVMMIILWGIRTVMAL